MNLRLPKQTVGVMFMGGDGAVDKTHLCCGRSGSIPTAISTNVHLSHLTLSCSRGERPLTYIYIANVSIWIKAPANAHWSPNRCFV